MAPTEKKNERLFIIGVEVENFKRISLVKIIPNDKGLTVIGGDNKQGKSSLLDAMMAALAGERGVPDRPIRDGKDKGLAVVKLSNGLIVRRSFTEKGGGLTVTTDEGHRIMSPQKALDSPFGGIGFDPIKFIDVTTPKEEREQMQKLLDALGIDFDELDGEKEKAFSERSDVNREVKRLEGAISEIPHCDDLPDEETSITELTQMYEEATEVNASIQKKGDKVVDLESRVDEIKAEIKRLKKEMSEAKDQAGSLREELSAMEEQDIGAIKQKMSTIEEENRKVRDNKERSRINAQLVGKKSESEKITGKLKTIDEKKRKLVEEADIPIKGLDFGEEGLIYNGIPLKQVSSSEKLAVAIALADILSPKSRLVLIREGSNLDPSTLLEVAKISKARGLQVIMERVSKGGEVDFLIEDGQVAKKA